MEYNRQKFENYDLNNYIEIEKKYFYESDNNFIKKLINLQDKISELNNKIDFCKKYEDELKEDLNDKIINNTIKNIEQVIQHLNNNIITKGQFNRKSNIIEIEF